MAHRPTVVFIDLTQLAAGGGWSEWTPAGGAVCRVSWRGRDEALDKIGIAGGSALAVALHEERLRSTGTSEPALVIAVGDAVRRGVPTAARACVSARSPLTGRYAEGQVGSGLAVGLLPVADAIVLTGETEFAGAVLELDPRAGVRLHSLPALVGQPSAAVPALIEEELGAGCSLRIGPAGEARVPFASLATGADEESFVGRGGMGAVLGGMGLKAVFVRTDSSAGPSWNAQGGEGSSGGELARALLASPRLEQRSRSGGFELMHAFAARGDLRGAGGESAVAARVGAELSDAANAQPHERRGCRGCPTPCGWVFADLRSGTADVPRKATFSAVRALGVELGFESLEPALELLGDCDAAGIDAVEAGAVLRLWAEACDNGRVDEAAAWGDLAEMRARLADLTARRGRGAQLALGASELGRKLGFPEAQISAAHGQAVAPDSNLAAVLGQCVGTGGADPMRSFPFAVEGGGAGADDRLRGLVAPILVPDGASDPHSPTGKGRLVFWHENLVAALDATGFCVFSGAALLADELTDLDGLARSVLPDAWRDEAATLGSSLLGLGASVVVLRHRIDREWEDRAEPGGPAWARALLGQPGMLDEYRVARGLDDLGRPRAETLSGIGTARMASPWGPLGGGAEAKDGRAGEEGGIDHPQPREFELRAVGILRDSIGDSARFRVPLPAPLVDVLSEVVRRRPAAERYLLRDGELWSAVYRNGERLTARTTVRPGDVLDVVMALRGG